MNVSSNSTTFRNRTFYDMNAVDIPQTVIYFVVLFLLLVVEVYILASFSHFVRMKRKFDKHRSGRSGVSRKRKILIALIMSVTITGIFRSALFFALLFFPNRNLPSAKACTLFLNLFYVIYIGGLTFLYSFLWFRQHTLYALPVMQKIVPISMKRFSDSLLALILISAVGAAAGFVLGNPPERIIFDAETRTCIFLDFDFSNLFIVNIVSYFMLVVFQVLLLFCFVYILRRHQAETKKHLQGESEFMSRNSSHSLQRLIRNCVKAAAICMVTDITILAISVNLPTRARLYNLILFDLDYIINLSCAVFCFSSWKEMIDPWMLKATIHRVCCPNNCFSDLQNPNSTHPTSSDNAVS